MKNLKCPAQKSGSKWFWRSEVCWRGNANAVQVRMSSHLYVKDVRAEVFELCKESQVMTVGSVLPVRFLTSPRCSANSTKPLSAS